eukprot:2794234-Prorocentrum_lima.AAC.1
MLSSRTLPSSAVLSCLPRRWALPGPSATLWCESIETIGPASQGPRPQGGATTPVSRSPAAVGMSVSPG